MNLLFQFILRCFASTAFLQFMLLLNIISLRTKATIHINCNDKVVENAEPFVIFVCDIIIR